MRAVRLAQLEPQRDYERTYGTKQQQLDPYLGIFFFFFFFFFFQDQHHEDDNVSSQATAARASYSLHFMGSYYFTMDGDMLEHGLSLKNNNKNTVNRRIAWKHTTKDCCNLLHDEKDIHDDDNEEAEELPIRSILWGLVTGSTLCWSMDCLPTTTTR